MYLPSMERAAASSGVVAARRERADGLTGRQYSALLGGLRSGDSSSVTGDRDAFNGGRAEDIDNWIPAELLLVPAMLDVRGHREIDVWNDALMQ